MPPVFSTFLRLWWLPRLWNLELLSSSLTEICLAQWYSWIASTVKKTGNLLQLWILRVCFTGQNQPEAHVKRQRGSKWVTLPAVKDYANKGIHTRRTSNGPGMPKSQSASWILVRCFQRRLKKTGNASKGAVTCTLGSTTGSTRQS